LTVPKKDPAFPLLNQSIVSTTLTTMAAEDCIGEYNVYNAVSIVSLALTLSVVCYYRSQRYFVDAPEQGKKFFIACGIIKVVLGVLLLTVFYPQDCGDVGSYGIVVIVIACIWFARAVRLSNSNPASPSTEMPVAQAPVGKEIV
jgi:uncharacterized membrane protein HdeD (DUF308 family)